MPTIRTACPRDCYDTCGLVATVDDAGQLLAVRGDPDHPVTRGLTCPRAAADPLRLTRNRVKTPLLRAGDALIPASWEDALDTIARRLRETLDRHGPEAILLLDFAGSNGLLAQTFSQRLWHALGATFTDQALCSKSGAAALSLHYGARYGLEPEELLEADLIVFWGFNAEVSSPHLWALARQAQEIGGATLVTLDPRRTTTADASDLWLRPRPGSDVALAYGVMHVVISRGAIDQDFVAEHTTGYPALANEAQRWTPERTSLVTGVAADAIERLAGAYARSSRSATLIGIGLQKADRGADAVRAVSFLPALRGRHRGFYYSNGDAFRVDRARLSGASLPGGPQRIVSQIALPEALAGGHFRFVYVQLMNPALTLTGSGSFGRGVSRPDVFLAVHDTHQTETTDLADVVLPGLTYLEKDDLVLPWSHSYVQFSPRLVSPRTDGRTEVWVMQELAQRLGLSQGWLHEDPWKAVEEATADAWVDGNLNALRAGERLRLRRRPAQHYPTPSGRIEFVSTLAVRQGVPPLPLQSSLPGNDGWFTLITSAVPRHTHTQFREVYGPLPPHLHIHPADAAWLGIAEGDSVAVSNDLGRLLLSAHLTDDVPPGVCWAPHQAPDLEGRPQNSLMGLVPQSIGGGPRFNSTRVSLSPA